VLLQGEAGLLEAGKRIALVRVEADQGLVEVLQDVEALVDLLEVCLISQSWD